MTMFFCHTFISGKRKNLHFLIKSNQMREICGCHFGMLKNSLSLRLFSFQGPFLCPCKKKKEGVRGDNLNFPSDAVWDFFLPSTHPPFPCSSYESLILLSLRCQRGKKKRKGEGFNYLMDFLSPTLVARNRPTTVEEVFLLTLHSRISSPGK